MLYTDLKHIERNTDFERVLKENENVAIICGRMDYNSISAYRIASELIEKYQNIGFFDLEWDNPEFEFLHRLTSTQLNTEIPYIILLNHGEIVKITTDVSDVNRVDNVIKEVFQK